MLFNSGFSSKKIALSIALFGGGAFTAHAQTGTSASPSEGVLEEITVTATRDETLLSKTPIAVSSISSEGLRDAGITNPTALGDAVPNLSIDRNNGLQITIRGVTSTDQTEKGDPSAAFLIDGIYIARPQVQEASFFDLERVEVLRGPQGTLYGRNTTAGLVNVISAKPKHEFASTVDATLGNYGTQQFTAMVNLPVNEMVALRAAVNYDKRDSFLIDNKNSPFSLDPSKKNTSVRLSGLFNFSDSATLLMTGDYTQMKGSTVNAVLLSNFFQMPVVAPAAGQAGVDPVYINSSSEQKRLIGYSTYSAGNPFSTQPRRDNNTWGVMADFSYAINNQFTLAYLGGYREFTRDEVIGAYTGSVYTPTGTEVVQIVGPQTFTGDYAQQSHELRLSYKGERIKAQAGAYYFREQSGIEFLLYGAQGAPGTRGYIFGFPQDPTIAKSLAFFAQSTYNLTDALHLTAGIRHTKDDKSRVGATIFHVNVGDPLDFTTGPNATVNPAGRSDGLNNASASFTKTTWKVGLDYDLSEATLLYGTISTGYKAGGFNDGCVAGATNCVNPLPQKAVYYDPETLTSYELGFRTKLADNALHLNGNLFHYDYKNLQLSQLSGVCGGPCNVTSNAGTAKVDGVELESIVAPNISNRIDLSIAWLNARFTDWEIVPGLNFKGKKLDRSPEWVVALGYTYTLSLGNGGNLQFGAHSKYSDDYYLISSAARAQFRQPSFTKTDATITYNAPSDTWYVQAFGKNLEDNITISSVFLSVAFPGLNGGTVQFADPRTFGVRAGLKF